MDSGSGEEEYSSDAMNDREPLLQRRGENGPSSSTTTRLQATNGAPGVAASTSTRPAGGEYRLTNMAAGTGKVLSLWLTI